MDTYVIRRLLGGGKFGKLWLERGTEPIHLNLLSLLVWVFGSYRAKVKYDLVVRQQYAFPLLYAADSAARYGIKELTVIEFGVAGGAGLMNMCRIAERTRKATGVSFHVFGFDTGKGMPPAVDYRDLPEVFREGDYPMDFDKLAAALPDYARLIIGDVEETIPAFLAGLRAGSPIGFVAIDVDYYSSAKKALTVFTAAPDLYLPMTPVYLDDIGVVGCNPWTGELLAVNEFNQEHPYRKIAPFNLLRSRRIFKNPQWIDRMFAAHIHDHTLRSPQAQRQKPAILRNEYLKD